MWEINSTINSYDDEYECINYAKDTVALDTAPNHWLQEAEKHIGIRVCNKAPASIRRLELSFQDYTSTNPQQSWSELST